MKLTALLLLMCSVVFAVDPPFSVTWQNRAPIGQDVLGGAANATNPRGWFNGANVDYESVPTGQLAFSNAILARIASEMVVLTNSHAQGVILWDIEGDENLAYIGDPRMMPVLAPEMDLVADEVFSKLRNGGFAVGITLRPRDLRAGDTLPTGTNGDNFILTSGSFGSKTYYYTNGWVQQSLPFQYWKVTTNSYNDLSNKIAYASSRWGCTLFYIDSYGFTVDHPFFGTTSVQTLTNIQNIYPNILLSPEIAAFATQATNMFAMSLPYMDSTYTGYFPPANALTLYPNARGLIKFHLVDTDTNSMVASMKAGNIGLLISSSANTTAERIGAAYLLSLSNSYAGTLNIGTAIFR